MNQRHQRREQYVETGRRIGGFLGGVIAFLAPFSALIPKAWWVALLVSLASLGSGIVGRATAPPDVSRSRDSAVVARLERLDRKVEKSDSTMRAGFAGTEGRLQRIEGVVALVSLRVGVDREIRRERERQERERMQRQERDRLRREMFPYGETPTDPNTWPAFGVNQ